MKRNSSRFVRCLILGLLLFPTAAFADAGTPMMWLGVFHLFIGNALVGLGEGLLIAWLFRVRKLRSILIMVPANYTSMIAGNACIGLLSYHFQSAFMGEEGFYHVLWALWLTGIGSWLLSVVVEWPFCLWILKDKPNRGRTSAFASLIAQTASYAVLVPLYLSAGSIDLYTKVSRDPSLQFARDVHAVVYFIDPNDGGVYRICANGSNLQKLVDAGLTNYDTGLFLGPGDWWTNIDLWAYRSSREANDVLLLRDLPQVLPADIYPSNILPAGVISPSTNGQESIQKAWLLRHVTADLRPPSDRDWDVRTGFWPVEGLRATKAGTGERLHLALETPFVSFSMNNATVLPGNKVIFEGGNQILILDIEKRVIGLLAYGRSPVVAVGNCP